MFEKIRGAFRLKPAKTYKDEAEWMRDRIYRIQADGVVVPKLTELHFPPESFGALLAAAYGRTLEMDVEWQELGTEKARRLWITASIVLCWMAYRVAIPEEIGKEAGNDEEVHD